MADAKPARTARWGWRAIVTAAIGLVLAFAGALTAVAGVVEGIEKGFWRDDVYAAGFMATLLLLAGGMTLYLARKVARKGASGGLDPTTVIAVGVAHTLPEMDGGGDASD